jgi:SHS2 domain-containing protein
MIPSYSQVSIVIRNTLLVMINQLCHCQGISAKKIETSMKHFEILDHTADIGLVIYGEDLKALFENAGEAFFHLITDLRKVKRRIERRVDIGGESLDRLMVDWLSELLYLHDTENLLFKGFNVESVGGDGLKAMVKGEPFREGVHVIKTEVKAVTYHQIEVRENNGRWRAQIIIDL